MRLGAVLGRSMFALSARSATVLRRRHLSSVRTRSIYVPPEVVELLRSCNLSSETSRVRVVDPAACLARGPAPEERRVNRRDASNPRSSARAQPCVQPARLSAAPGRARAAALDRNGVGASDQGIMIR